MAHAHIRWGVKQGQAGMRPLSFKDCYNYSCAMCGGSTCELTETEANSASFMEKWATPGYGYVCHGCLNKLKGLPGTPASPARHCVFCNTLCWKETSYKSHVCEACTSHIKKHLAGKELTVKEFDPMLGGVKLVPKVMLPTPESNIKASLRELIGRTTTPLFLDHKPCGCNRCKEK